MKLTRFLLIAVVLFALQALAQAPPAGQAQQPAVQAPAQEPAGQPPAQTKQITNKEEYDAYVAAINAKDPKALQAFIEKYPNTVVKEDALEVKMALDVQGGKGAEAANTAGEILKVNPRNVRAAAVLTSIFVQTPLSASDPQLERKLSQVEQAARSGLEALPSFEVPNAKTPEETKKAKDELAANFHYALGLVGLGRKQLPAAQDEFAKAAEIQPNSSLFFYQLGSAIMVEKQEPKLSKGFYALARAVAYTGLGSLPEVSRTQIDNYLKTQYTRYHGSDQGLAELKQMAASTPFPPADFHIDTVAEVLAKAPVDPANMDYYEIREMMLSNTPKADELWNKLKGTTRTFKGIAISGTPDVKPKTLRVVVAQDTGKKAGAYDLEIALTTPIAKLPADALDFTGVVNAFTKDPFTITMIDGKVAGLEAPPAAKKAPPAAKKAPAAKKRG